MRPRPLHAMFYAMSCGHFKGREGASCTRDIDKDEGLYFQLTLKAELVSNTPLQFHHVKTVTLEFSSPNARFGHLPVRHQHSCAQMGGVGNRCVLKNMI